MATTGSRGIRIRIRLLTAFVAVIVGLTGTVAPTAALSGCGQIVRDGLGANHDAKVP